MNLTINPSFPPKLAVSDNFTEEDIAVAVAAAAGGDEEAEDVVFGLFFEPGKLASANYMLLAKLALLIEAADNSPKA